MYIHNVDMAQSELSASIPFAIISTVYVYTQSCNREALPLFLSVSAPTHKAGPLQYSVVCGDVCQTAFL